MVHPVYNIPLSQNLVSFIILYTCIMNKKKWMLEDALEGCNIIIMNTRTLQ